MLGDRRIENRSGNFQSVAQASNMVAVQAGCSVSHAVVLMVTRAQESNATLEHIAAAVVDGQISFEP